MSNLNSYDDIRSFSLYLFNATKSMTSALNTKYEQDFHNCLQDSLLSLNNAQNYIKKVQNIDAVSSYSQTVKSAVEKMSSITENILKEFSEFIDQASKTEFEKIDRTILDEFVKEMNMIAFLLSPLLFC